MSELEQWTLPDGRVVRLGNNKPPEQFAFRATFKWVDVPEFTDEQIKTFRPFDLTTRPGWPVKVRDQGEFGACNGHAAVTSLEAARWLGGYDHFDLSPWFVYAILCNGVDQGSYIAEAVDLLGKVGACRNELVPFGTIKPGKLTEAAYDDAQRFRVEISLGKCRSFRDMVIATALRYPFNFSVSVNTNFNTLDAEGVPGNRAGQHNHAVTGGLGLKWSDKHKSFLFKAQNSWSPAWGDKGYFWAAPKTVAGTWADSYFIQAVKVLDAENGPKVQP